MTVDTSSALVAASEANPSCHQGRKITRDFLSKRDYISPGDVEGEEQRQITKLLFQQYGRRAEVELTEAEENRRRACLLRMHQLVEEHYQDILPETMQIAADLVFRSLRSLYPNMVPNLLAQLCLVIASKSDMRSEEAYTLDDIRLERDLSTNVLLWCEFQVLQAVDFITTAPVPQTFLLHVALFPKRPEHRLDDARLLADARKATDVGLYVFGLQDYRVLALAAVASVLIREKKLKHKDSFFRSWGLKDGKKFFEYLDLISAKTKRLRGSRRRLYVLIHKYYDDRRIDVAGDIMQVQQEFKRSEEILDRLTKYRKV